MIAAGTGLATGSTADDAALEASLAALERSGTDRADLAVVFATGDAYPRAHELLHSVRRVTGAPLVVDPYLFPFVAPKLLLAPPLLSRRHRS